MTNRKNKEDLKLSLEEFIRKIPKAELHVHIEGTLEPELMFKISKRNKLKIRFNSIDELKEAYDFSNLQDFLDIYYEGAKVLLTKKDFYELTVAYLKKAHSQNVLHAEIFFDPQTHTYRKVGFSTVFEGIYEATQYAYRKWGMSTKLIMCFLRHLDEDSALKTLKESLKYKQYITAVGLDSSEVGNPPSKFQKVFEEARKEGYLTVAHAGEEGPSSYVWEALDLLKVSRIDHGNRSLDDPKLIEELREKKMPLTLCPLSNFKLKVVDDLYSHHLKTMMKLGLLVMINSDDPAYFGGYVNENYFEIAKALKLSKKEIYILAKDSFEASFLNAQSKKENISKIEKFYSENK